MDAGAYVDVLPWIVFVIVDRKTGLGLAWAGGTGALCAGGLLGWSYWLGRWDLTAWVGVVLFTGCFAVGLALPGWSGHFYAMRPITVGVLAATAFASLRMTPLSCAFTSGQVRPSVRDDPRFMRVNFQITRAWGVGCTVAAAAYCIPIASRSAVASTFSDWVLPLVVAAATVKWSADRWGRFRSQVWDESDPLSHVVPLATSVDPDPYPPRMGTVRTLVPRQRRKA